jgi:hypothetical protein
MSWRSLSQYAISEETPQKGSQVSAFVSSQNSSVQMRALPINEEKQLMTPTSLDQAYKQMLDDAYKGESGDRPVQFSNEMFIMTS